MTYLVTGGAGFLGSHIVDELAARGYGVRIFDRQEPENLDSSSAVEFFEGDILDRQALAEALTDCDGVFHLAGMADLNEASSTPYETMQQNIVGTLNLLEAMRDLQMKRLMFASTVYIYSRHGGFYRCSKQACENFIEEYAEIYGLNFTILRYGSLYGPRADRRNGVYRLLDDAMNDRVISYDGNPQDVREYIHVQDAAQLSVDALNDEFLNRHLTITGHHPMRIADLFVMFQEILGKDVPVEYTDNPNVEGGHYSITPYAYKPSVGRKITSNQYVDMGQGVLQLIHEISEKLKNH